MNARAITAAKWSTQEVFKEEMIPTNELSERLARRLGGDRYDLWFNGSAQIGFTQEGAEVVVPSAFLRDLLTRSIGLELESFVRDELGAEQRLQFRIAEGHPSATAVNGATSISTLPEPTIPKAVAPVEPQPLLSAVAEGAENRLACQAARRIIAGGFAGVPVVFCGGSASGKSLLLESIRDDYRRRNRASRALSVNAEEFTAAFLEALRGRGIPSFRRKHRQLQLLLVDDLQFLVGKKATIDEFQYTVDQVLTSGGQVVVTADRPLREITELGPSLISRLSAGVACEIAPPGPELRGALVRRMATTAGILLADHLVARIARHAASDSRWLAGLVNQLAARHQLLGEALDAALVDRVLGTAERHLARPVQLGDIDQVICAQAGIEVAELRSANRSQQVTQLRMVAMWLARKYTPAAWREIGEHFGGRSHSTVIAAHRRVEQSLQQTAGDTRCDRLPQLVARCEAALRAS